MSDERESTGSSMERSLKWDGNHFHRWKVTMVAYLKTKKWHSAITTALAPEADDEKEEDAKKREIASKAFYAIWTAMNGELQDTFISCEQGDAHALWTSLVDRFESDTDAKKQDLRRQLHLIKMKTDEGFDSYRGRLMTIVSQLAAAGDRVDEATVKSTLMMGLPRTFASKVDTINEIGLSKKTLDELCKSLRDHHERLMLMKDEDDREAQVAAAAHALVSSQSFRGYQGQPSGGRGRGGRGGWGGGRGGASARGGGVHAMYRGGGAFSGRGMPGACWTCKGPHRAYDCPQNRDAKKCTNCRVIGHSDDECYSRSNQGHGYSAEEEEQMHAHAHAFQGQARTAMQVGCHGAIMPHEAHACQERSYLSALMRKTPSAFQVDKFILDSGATSHFVMDESMLTDKKKVTPPMMITTANQQQVAVTTKGTCRLRVPDGNGHATVDLKEVLLAPSFGVNLISNDLCGDDHRRCKN
jgi:hypothetical protein